MLDVAEARAPTSGGREALLARYERVRAFTESLCEGLEVEDQVVQSMPDVSPTKWHLAHTSWFFETFAVAPHLRGWEPLDPRYAYLFNSYYVHAGERHCRAQRGYISRPTVAQVAAYRAHVDRAVRRLLDTASAETFAAVAAVLELGIHHEQQHQELLVTDIKHVLSVNPLRPAYREAAGSHEAAGGNGVRDAGSGSWAGSAHHPPRWVECAGGLVEIGWDGAGFAYDNEGPRHKVWLEPHALADRLVTNAEYLAFMQDGGYGRPELWLSMGWDAVRSNGWTEPFYWERRDGEWWTYTVHGMRPVEPSEPAVHLSYFEADAFARWAGARLPEEAEWEAAAATLPVEGNFVESGRLHPAAAPREASPEEAGGGAVGASGAPALRQMFGDVWEWTRSPYSPYPGYRPAEGALGEYNGKFMCNQLVLRGGSCATSVTHVRPTYRNFFPPEATWQLTGVRLARDA